MPPWITGARPCATFHPWYRRPGILPSPGSKSRTDPVTKAVGYDKAAMVFHMLHQEVGEATFWRSHAGSLRQFLFKKASWQDLQNIFERQAGRSPWMLFFRQWIDRPGMPRRLDWRMSGGFRVRPAIGQAAVSFREKPYYRGRAGVGRSHRAGFGQKGDNRVGKANGF